MIFTSFVTRSESSLTKQMVFCYDSFEGFYDLRYINVRRGLNNTVYAVWILNNPDIAEPTIL